jgi:predicted alpha/beta-fold hydrolase
VLGRIEVPTLLLNARNDPFLPQAALPGRDEVSPSVCLEFPDQGGHASFVSAPFPGNLDWMPRRVAAFFAEAMAAREAGPVAYANIISNQGAVPR